MDSEGNLTLNDTSNEYNDVHKAKHRLNRMLRVARKHQHLKVLFAVGGWGNSQFFSPVLADPYKRANFISNIERITNRYSFDGVDIDWEYPVRGGAQEGIPQDKENYVTFLKELRGAFNQYSSRPLIISIASAAGEDALRAGYNLEAISEHVDFINVMSYDYYGPWQSDAGEITGPPAPLYMGTPPNTSGTLNVHWSLKYYSCRIQDNRKINMGVPFYGRYWKHVEEPLDHSNPMWRKAARPNGNFEGGALNWFEIDTMFDKNHTKWHTKAKTPYIHDSERKMFFGFENERSLQEKMHYVNKHDLGGVMIWSLDGDDNSYTLFNTILSNLCSSTPKSPYKCVPIHGKRWYTWADDGPELAGRCGPNAPAVNGKYMAVCNPEDSEHMCCSAAGYCGGTDEYCNCDSCINYKERPDLIDQPADSDVVNFNSRIHYKVKLGDTGWVIAQKYGITVEQLRQMNAKKNIDMLQVNMILRIQE